MLEKHQLTEQTKKVETTQTIQPDPHMEPTESQVYQVLEELRIPYTRDTHEACFTVEQAKEHGLNRPGINVKNLVILDKKPENTSWSS